MTSNYFVCIGYVELLGRLVSVHARRGGRAGGAGPDGAARLPRGAGAAGPEGGGGVLRLHACNVQRDNSLTSVKIGGLLLELL